MNEKRPYKLTDKVYVTSSAIIEFGSAGSYTPDAANSGKGYGTASTHTPWGEKDDILYEMHKLCCENPTKWRLMTTKRDFVIGTGLQAAPKNEISTIPTPAQRSVESFFELIFLHDLLKDAALQLEFCSRFFVKLTLGTDGNVADIELIDPFHCRPRRMVAGESRVSSYILNPNFGTKKYRRNDDKPLPAFDRRNPKKFAVSVMDIRENLPGQIYHPFGIWWGTKEWTKVANQVPSFHSRGMENGWNLKYHVSIPDDYFDDDGLSLQEQEKMKMNFCEQVDSTLKGKSDSVLFTFHKMDSQGKEMEGVRVKALANVMSDDAFTVLFNTANQTQSSAHGLPPVLAGIETGSKLGGSGKEMEVAARYTQNFLTISQRALLLQFVGYLIEIQELDTEKTLKYEFGNIEMYNFDVTPTNDNTNPNSNATN